MGIDMARTQSFHMEQKIQAETGDGKKQLGCQADKRSNNVIYHDLTNTEYTG